MPTRYRSRTEIIAQILQVANGGITRTRIMYNAFLTYGQLKEYLGILIENGLLEYVEAKRIYKTTEKGLKFLKTFEQIEELVPQLKLPELQK